MSRPRRVASVLLVGIALGSALLSFSGLAHLGHLAGYTGVVLGVSLAAVFALVVDAGALAATLFWLYGDTTDRRTVYAQRLALTLIGVSVVGNFASHSVIVLPWWLAGIVASVASLELAAIIHLLAMPARQAPSSTAGLALDTAPASPVATSVRHYDLGLDVELPTEPLSLGTLAELAETDRQHVASRQPASPPAPAASEVASTSPAASEVPAELVARGLALVSELGKVPGRPTLRDRLAITDHQARQLQPELRKAAA